MNRFRAFSLVLVFFLLTGGGQALASSWRLVLPESVTVASSRVLISDIVSAPVPAAAGELMLLGRGKPGTTTAISRQIILRKLVEAGLASGVIIQGASSVQVSFVGREISAEALRKEIREKIQPLVPAGQIGAPPAWFEMNLPETKLALAAQPEIQVLRTNPLVPGRNLLRIRLQSPNGHQDLPVTAILHSFGEIPTAKLIINRDTPLIEGLFSWTWFDLSEIQGQFVSSRQALLGCRSGRTLAAGDKLRLNDLKAIPAINSGDMVDLKIQRGGLLVTVRALARKAGCLGQTIPVRNELNGRIVNARVAGAGTVEWRR